MRAIGTTGKNHELTTPGDFAGPTGVALDKDGNVYVTDTMNYRVEIFDGDGKYISQFGQHCDSYGCFAHPKGIAIDSDGHIWVADPCSTFCRSSTRDGQLLAFVGGHGSLPGQFSSLVDVYIDKQKPGFHLRTVSRPGADVPLYHRCRGGEVEAGKRTAAYC